MIAMFGTSSMKFVVVGLGLFGKRLASKLAEMGHQVLAIDREEEPVSRLQDKVDKAVIGDVKQEGFLEEMITDEVDALFVTMAADLEASLLSVLQAKEIGVNHVIAKSNGPKHTTILRRLDIQHIISPEEDVAEQLAEEVGNPRIHEYIQLQEDHSIVEMTVPDSFVGKSLKELDLRNEHKIQVIGVQKNVEGRIDYVPSPTEPFEPEDVVWMTGPDDALQELSRT